MKTDRYRRIDTYLDPCRFTCTSETWTLTTSDVEGDDERTGKFASFADRPWRKERGEESAIIECPCACVCVCGRLCRYKRAGTNQTCGANTNSVFIR